MKQTDKYINKFYLLRRMDWKKFYKPSLSKVVIFFFFFIILLFLFSTIDWPCCFCENLKTGIELEKCGLVNHPTKFLFKWYSLFVHAIIYTISCFLSIKYLNYEKK
tara:strand:- start:41 stop:358 length:318 start_codon:yes stop_codon:yes gene_type:complete